MTFLRDSAALDFNKAHAVELVRQTSCWGEAGLSHRLARLTATENASPTEDGLSAVHGCLVLSDSPVNPDSCGLFSDPPWK